MPIKIKPATGAGSVSLEAQDAISSDFTLTLPGVTGTVNTSGAVNQVPAGSVSAPSIFPAGDTNTGIYFPAADTIGFVEGGVESMRLDASGNLGLGVTPSAWRSAERAFDVGSYASFINSASAGGAGVVSNAYKNASSVWIYRNTYTASLYEQNTLGDHRWFTAPSGTAGDAISFTERARIDSSGNLLVNTTTRTGAERMALWYSSNTGPGLNIRDTSAQNGNTFIQFNNGATTAGTITSNGTTTMTYGSASDYRLKENIQPLTGSLDRVLSLKPVTYTWKIDGSEGRGFIAHELQEVIPECVSGLKDALYDDGSPRYQYVDQAHLGAHLVAAIQELSAKLDAAEARIAALEAK